MTNVEFEKFTARIAATLEADYANDEDNLTKKEFAAAAGDFVYEILNSLGYTEEWADDNMTLFSAACGLWALGWE